MSEDRESDKREMLKEVSGLHAAARETVKRVLRIESQISNLSWDALGEVRDEWEAAAKLSIEMATDVERVVSKIRQRIR